MGNSDEKIHNFQKLKEKNSKIRKSTKNDLNVVKQWKQIYFWSENNKRKISVSTYQLKSHEKENWSKKNTRTFWKSLIATLGT